MGKYLVMNQYFMQSTIIKLESLINNYYNNKSNLVITAIPLELSQAIEQVLQLLDNGTLRVAEKINSHWVVHDWLKKAILLSFIIYPAQVVNDSWTKYYDKFPSKFTNYTQEDFIQQKIRVVPPASARHGCYLAPNTILMTSYVNIGAYIDSGCMIDSYALVGSCAQIGKNVHISGGAGIGGVLEPLQAKPTIIEDNCFIGAGSWIVEGVIVERNSVIAANVTLSQSTKIYNRSTGEISYGRIPEGSVVVPGTLPADDHTYALQAAIIVKTVDEQTRSKTSLNELLRD
jgi:2,3,4,5-tetrahydropyridine-2-carboxylate N-succinyltransferase